jgi:hypothetical protein
MSKQTVQSVVVETKEAKLLRLRKEYILEQWPSFLKLFPGMPEFRGVGPLEQKAVEMLEHSYAAHVTITGVPVADEDLPALLVRPTKDFIKHLKSDYNRANLADQWRIVRDQFMMDLEE